MALHKKKIILDESFEETSIHIANINPNLYGRICAQFHTPLYRRAHG